MKIPTVVLLALLTGCSQPTAHPAKGPEAVFEERRDEILNCEQVCEYGGWYFTSVAVRQTGDARFLTEKGKLEAASRIWLFLEEPETYERLYVTQEYQESSSSTEARINGDIRIVVVASGPLASGAGNLFGVTAAGRPTSLSASSQ